jgi:hypothetical protein
MRRRIESAFAHDARLDDLKEAFSRMRRGDF